MMLSCALCEYRDGDDQHGARGEDGFTEERTGLYFCAADTEALLSWQFNGCPEESERSFEAFVWATRAYGLGDPPRERVSG